MTISQRAANAAGGRGMGGGCWPSMNETPTLQKLGVVSDTCNPRTQEVKAEGPKFKTILSYIAGPRLDSDR